MFELACLIIGFFVVAVLCRRLTNKKRLEVQYTYGGKSFGIVIYSYSKVENRELSETITSIVKGQMAEGTPPHKTIEILGKHGYVRIIEDAPSTDI